MRAPGVVLSVVRLTFYGECPKNKKGNGTGGGTNQLYAIKNCHEREDLPDVVTCMIQVLDFTFYSLLDPRASYILYVAMNFDVISEQLSELFNVSTSTENSSMVEKFYRDCTISRQSQE